MSAEMQRGDIRTFGRASGEQALPARSLVLHGCLVGVSASRPSCTAAGTNIWLYSRPATQVCCCRSTCSCSSLTPSAV